MEDFSNVATPPYAILSHTWETEEVSFLDMTDVEAAKCKRGFRKIQYACDQALQDDLRFVWIDTCCIDKRSSAELQEAINSMYRWYQDAAICYAYLSDIMSSCPPLSDHRILPRRREPRPTDLDSWVTVHDLRTTAEENEELDFWAQVLRKCKWFDRGWTLQELIAPKRIKFYGTTWNWIGTKSTLLSTLSEITHVDVDVLTHRVDPAAVCVARRMSWAASRSTSREEDEAYSLLGIMGVNMPLLYGEGRKAFQRLQEEIVRSTKDLSIFAWQSDKENADLFATSPSDFRGSHNVSTFGHPDDLELTASGIRIRCPVEVTGDFETATECLVVLNCQREETHGSTLGLYLQRESRHKRFFVINSTLVTDLHPEPMRSRLCPVEMRAVSRAQLQTLEIVKISERPSQDVTITFQLAVDQEDSDTIGTVTGTVDRKWDRYYPRACRVRVPRHLASMKEAVLLQHRLGEFCVTFGGNIQNVYSQSDISRLVGVRVACNGHLNGQPGLDSFGIQAYSWEPCVHGIDCNDLTGHTCTKMQQTHRAWDSTNSIALTASVNLCEVYGELLCEVQASFGKLSDRSMSTGRAGN